jgi:hypothetical protein
MFEIDEDNLLFQKELAEIKSDITQASWNSTTIVDRFKGYFQYLATMFRYKNRVAFIHKQHMNTGELFLEVEMVTEFGKLATTIPISYIISNDCPKNFPQLLLVGFGKSFDKKYEFIQNKVETKKIMEHKPEPTKLTVENLGVYKNNGVYQCPDCGKTYTKASSFRMHILKSRECFTDKK